MFIVKVQEVKPGAAEPRYESTVDIYEQRVEVIDLEAVIRAVNRIAPAAPTEGPKS